MRAVRAVASAAVALAAACASVGTPLDEARRKDGETAAAHAATLAAKGSRAWVVVEHGAVVATGPTADDTARMAVSRAAGDAPLHRYVFRATDPGDRLYRMAFLPEGGRVAGRRFLAELGFRVLSVGEPGARRVVVLERRGGSRRTVDLARTPRLRIELRPLAGGEGVVVDAPLDPDFDGPLLLPPETAAPLDLVRAEIPGRADVQVALGRPFQARRAWAFARCAHLDASGVVEVVTR